MGDEGDVMLLDPARYGIGLRAGPRIDTSPHVEFTTDRTVVTAIVIDGDRPGNDAVTCVA